MSGATAWTSQLWLDTFGQLLNDGQLYHEDRWSLNFNYNSLTEKVTKEERKRGWKVYNHCAFGNFRCESCPNTWPSARVVVLFRYRLGEDRGTVIMRPFCQMCRDCDNNGFRRPGFSNVEVERALSRLFSRIRRNCYGEDDDSDHGSADSHVITKPHEKSLCEACTMGICSQDED